MLCNFAIALVLHPYALLLAKKVSPTFQPIKSNAKTNHDLFARALRSLSASYKGLLQLSTSVVIGQNDFTVLVLKRF